MSAVSAARQGMSVGLLEPGTRIGGMSTGGLMHTDVGNSKVIGGMALEFYRSNGLWYNSTKPMFNLEPHVALELFLAMLSEANVTVFYRAAVASVGVDSQGTLTALSTTDERSFSAKVFVDSSYEGDLMARAGVDHRVGREAAGEYNESLNGYRLKNQGHEFSVAIDPYDSDGNILPMLSAANTSMKLGMADKRVQAYNYRLCVTRQKDNQVAFSEPQGYDPEHWELARRYFTHPAIAPKVKAPCGNTAGYCGGPSANPDKWDLNNGGPISTDFVGGSWEYPEANYSRREAIREVHKFYTESFLWFMSTDPALGSSIRDDFRGWGLCADEFQDSGHFPTQLYVRAARRLVGDRVFSQNTPSLNRSWGNLSIGCGSYNFDSHTAERIACPNSSTCGAGPQGGDQASFAWNEGDVETAPGDYDIPLWVLLPKRTQASNLLVVAAPSATHIGMSTLRMEPQFMIMGQGAGVVAALAVQEAAASTPAAPASVHDVDTRALHQRLLDGGQLMNEACQGPRPPPAPPVPHVPSVRVVGAGTAGVDGVYVFDPSQHRDAGTGFYVNAASQRQLYRLRGVWRLAHDTDPLHLYYVTGNVSWALLPPSTGWRAQDGTVPAPVLANGTR